MFLLDRSESVEHYMIDEKYLPFTAEDLRPHFLADTEGHIRYYEASAERYHSFLETHRALTGIPLNQARTPRQIEKDERFWTVTATKRLFDSPNRAAHLAMLLTTAFGPTPPIAELGSWSDALDGELRLYFEACLPSPRAYGDHLKSTLPSRHMIPYVLDAAARPSKRSLEGPTHVDALLLNESNGFAILIEAKVLSDISCDISFDVFRNQLVRNIDIMLDECESPGALHARAPSRSLLCLLTPSWFREHPASRFYGLLFHHYRNDPEMLARDLRHRSGIDWSQVARRIGWLTFEDIEAVHPGACPWMKELGGVAVQQEN
jgi:hypothetical protein